MFHTYVNNCIKCCTNNIKLNISYEYRNNFLSQSEELYTRDECEMNNKLIYEPICMKETNFVIQKSMK